jgi:hypothetical protein
MGEMGAYRAGANYEITFLDKNLILDINYKCTQSCHLSHKIYVYTK